MLKGAGVARYDWYPMIRGRLVAVNGRTVTPDDYAEDRAKRLVDREFNVSFNAPCRHKTMWWVVQWTTEEAGAISVEEGIATTLKLKLGDPAV
jgi:putative ABC transport system permease protein